MAKEIITFGFGYDIGFNHFEKLMEELPKYVSLYKEVKDFEAVRNNEVKFYDDVTDRALQFTFEGELDGLEKTIRHVLKKEMPKMLFSRKFMRFNNEASKGGYKLARKILIEEFGKMLVDSKDVCLDFDFIMDKE